MRKQLQEWSGIMVLFGSALIVAKIAICTMDYIATTPIKQMPSMELIGSVILVIGLIIYFATNKEPNDK